MIKIKDKIQSELFKIIQTHFDELIDPDTEFTDVDKLESLLFLILSILSNTSQFSYDLQLIAETEEGERIVINDDLLDEYLKQL